VTSPGRGRTAITSHIADDHSPVAEQELSAVVLPDPHPLDEPEGGRERGDRLTHVGIDQAGDMFRPAMSRQADVANNMRERKQ
jgi:hypothetical protein